MMVDDYDYDYDYNAKNEEIDNPWGLRFPHLSGKEASELTELLYELIWAFESFYSYQITRYHDSLERLGIRAWRAQHANINEGCESECPWGIDDDMDF
jgi:hypothetical protein